MLVGKTYRVALPLCTGVGLACLSCYSILVKHLAPSKWHLGKGLVRSIGSVCLIMWGAVSSILGQWVPGTHFMHVKGKITYYKGVVISHQSKKRNNTLLLNIHHVKTAQHWYSVSGKLQLKTRKSLHFKIGGTYLVRGTPTAWPTSKSETAYHYQKALERKQIYHQHHIYNGGHIIYIKPPSFYNVKAQLQHIRGALHRILQKYTPANDVYGMLAALLLGERQLLPKYLQAAYSRAGSFHALSISGLHISMIYRLLLWLLSCLSLGYLRRRRREQISIAFIWFYVLLTGSSPSTMRAAIMLSLFMLARFLRRRHNSYNLLAGAAFVNLLLDPGVLYTLSFQLSYLAAAGILYLQPKLHIWLHKQAGNEWMPLWRLSSVAIAAQLATGPLTVYYFETFPTYFLVTNVIVVPAIWFILHLSSWLILCSPWPLLARLVGYILGQCIQVLHQCMIWIAGWPYSQLGPWSTSTLGHGCLIIGMAVWLARRPHIKHVKLVIGLGIVYKLYEGYATIMMPIP